MKLHDRTKDSTFAPLDNQHVTPLSRGTKLEVE